MTSLQSQADELILQYAHLTGREARVRAYEYALFSFFQAGFTCDEFVLVLNFVLRENKKNNFKYSIMLGNLIRDHGRFMDLLGEAKAKDRNHVKPPTPKELVLESFRGVAPEPKGKTRHVSEVFNEMRRASL